VIFNSVLLSLFNIKERQTLVKKSNEFIIVKLIQSSNNEDTNETLRIFIHGQS
jgi:hypothetical protein